MKMIIADSFSTKKYLFLPAFFWKNRYNITKMANLYP